MALARRLCVLGVMPLLASILIRLSQDTVPSGRTMTPTDSLNPERSCAMRRSTWTPDLADGPLSAACAIGAWTITRAVRTSHERGVGRLITIQLSNFDTRTSSISVVSPKSLISSELRDSSGKCIQRKHVPIRNTASGGLQATRPRYKRLND